MTPGQLRSALKSGKWTAVVPMESLPDPPAEWAQWKRKRLAVAIRCAVLFVFHGKRMAEISKIVGGEKAFDKRRVTKQRMSQYISRGLGFLMEHGVFVAVGRDGEEQ